MSSETICPACEEKKIKGSTRYVHVCGKYQKRTKRKTNPMSNELCKCGKVGEISCPNDERCGTVIQLPADQLEEIKKQAKEASEKRYKKEAVNFEYLEYEAGWEDCTNAYATWKIKYNELSEELRQAQLTAKSLRYSLDQRDKELSELKARCDKMEAALKELCYLKKLKEEEGRTNEYMEKQPVAWENAFELIKLTPEKISDIKEAIDWYRSPEGMKEGENPCPHCGKELSRDRNLCCRECGKEVENG
jgi:DNA repair exonuclease SbcCD ATPase subunit